jgi:trehalose 6-phosphate synthase
MRACSGTWIAHGSGSADKDVVDSHGRIGVPIDNPAYTLRRVWLTRDEENGYYYGFANEGLWPLCHIAHVRPTFRASDWEAYREVNQKFANAVVAESQGPDPIILIQDYHFALLPRMIREKLPEATIITFSTDCLEAASLGSTLNSIATTSWIPSTAFSRREWTARHSTCRTGSSRRR